MVYKQKEVCKRFNITSEKLQLLVRASKIEIAKKSVGGRLCCVYTTTILKKLGLLKEGEKFQQEEETESNNMQHPLVTDPKFLKLSFFPDVVPECFKSEEECI